MHWNGPCSRIRLRLCFRRRTGQHPALTYEKYKRVYHRHYSADNCCITLYGKMDMAEKLELLDRDYLSKMPKGTSRPQLTVQHEQAGAA